MGRHLSERRPSEGVRLLGLAVAAGALIHAPDPDFVKEASRRGVFAYIADADARDWQSSIDIVLRRCPHAAEPSTPGAVVEVRAVHVGPVPEENAEAEGLAVLVDTLLRRLRPDPEVDVEVAVERRNPCDRPAHTFLVG